MDEIIIMDPNERTYVVNFTYSTVTEMLEKTLGFNPDGSINVTYSLTELHNILSKNLECIDKLLQKTGSIKDIQLWSVDSVRVEIADQEDANWLLENRVITKLHELIEDEEKSYEDNGEDDLLNLEYLTLDNVADDNVMIEQEIEEKTEDTFKRIFRATSLDQNGASDNEDPEESRSDSEEVVSDPQYVNKIMNKYAVVADAMNSVYEYVDEDGGEEEHIEDTDTVADSEAQ